MSERVSFGDIGRRLGRSSWELRFAPEAAAIQTAPVLANAVKAQHGHAPPLKDLAPSTQAERERLGFSANEPLKRTGSLEESWHSAAEGPMALAGSSDPRARWHEDGNSHFPPRPVAAIGIRAATPFARRIFRRIVGRALGMVR